MCHTTPHIFVTSPKDTTSCVSLSYQTVMILRLAVIILKKIDRYSFQSSSYLEGNFENLAVAEDTSRLLDITAAFSPYGTSRTPKHFGKTKTMYSQYTPLLTLLVACLKCGLQISTSIFYFSAMIMIISTTTTTLPFFVTASSISPSPSSAASSGTSSNLVVPLSTSMIVPSVASSRSSATAAALSAIKSSFSPRLRTGSSSATTTTTTTTTSENTWQVSYSNE